MTTDVCETSSERKPVIKLGTNAVLRQLEELRTDEVQLIPTNDDVDQVARVAGLMG